MEVNKFLGHASGDYTKGMNMKCAAPLILLCLLKLSVGSTLFSGLLLWVSIKMLKDVKAMLKDVKAILKEPMFYQKIKFKMR